MSDKDKAFAEIVKMLASIYDRKNKANVSAQGQGMDGYTLLANYDAVAKQAWELIYKTEGA